MSGHAAGGWRATRHDRVDLGRQTAELVGRLGAEPSSVATALTEAGVNGVPADARQCAMAVYLRAVMQADPRVASVRVFHDRVVVGTPGRFRQHRVVVPLPASVRAFVAGFDAQRYPALVRRRQGATPAGPGPAGPGPAVEVQPTTS